MVGGEALQGDGSRLVKVHFVGYRDQVLGRHYRIISVAARPEERDDPVTLAHVLGSRAELGDRTRYLRAGHERQGGLFKVLVPATHGVRVINPGGFDLDKDLPLARRGTLDLHVLEHARVPELANPDRLHLGHLSSSFALRVQSPRRCQALSTVAAVLEESASRNT